MAIRVQKIELWNVVVDNRSGALASVLEPLADAGADLEVILGTGIPGGSGQASIGVFPIKGKKALAAARLAGMAPAPATSMPSLLVSGDNQAGLGRLMSTTLAAAGINIGFLVAQVVDGDFSALFGFASEADAGRAAALLKKMGSATSAKRAGAATRGSSVR